MPVGFAKTEQLQEGKFYCDRAFAGQMLLNFAPGYCAEISDSLPEKMSTRLAEESVTLWLAKIVDSVVTPYASGEHAWEMSVLRVRQSWWNKHKDEFEKLDGEPLRKWCAQQHQDKDFATVIVVTDFAACGYSANEGLIGMMGGNNEYRYGQFSLLTTPWLPVRFKDGSTGKLAPVDLADENVVDIAATRADLQGAAWQFLLGLLQCSIAPKRYKNWEDIWFDGLHADVLHKALAPLEHAFQFGAETPSFMQDFEPLSGEKVSIASLLPEIPGAQTTKFNKDHFVKRGVTERFCPHCAALALFSLQLNAPAGGKGYRTGLRGGGPLTTLVELQEYQGERQTPLWRKLWLNVMPQDTADLPLPDQCDATVFPWLAATRTSEQANAVTTPEQVNKLQAYWGMPRRIRLDFATLQSGCCDICGAESDELLGFMTVKNYGVNYDGWRHPLTPYRAPVKDQNAFFSVKPQPGGLIWRDWLGLSQNNQTEANYESPAQVVKVFNARSLTDVKAGIWGFGADFDNMKIRCWYEHHFPLLMTEGLIPDLRKAVQTAARLLSLLRSALKEAWFADAKGARGDFSFIDIDFWNLTQGRFLNLIHDLENGHKPDERLNKWQRELWLFTRHYFDDHVFTNPYESSDLERIMTARKKYFTTSAEKQSAKAAKAKKQEAAE